MGKQAIKYVPLCMGIYLALSAFEIFALRPLINLFETRFWVLMIIYNIFLLIVNPIATKLIIDKFFNFKSEADALTKAEEKSTK